MPRNNSRDLIVDQRREMVAHFRLRQMSMREIAAALVEKGIVNPETNKAYDVATIKRDIDAIDLAFKDSANIQTSEHATRQFAEIQEIKRAAWVANDPELALKALDREMKLLGTMKQPETININITMVNQLVQLVESRGERFEEWLAFMIQDFLNAENS